MKKIFLKPKKEEPLRRFHPWIFSGAIARWDAEPEEGETVEIRSHRDDFLAVGHYQKGSISVRVCSFEPVEALDKAFWHAKLKSAYTYRKSLGLTHHPDTNCYRLVHGEGDGLPGLIMDIYGTTAVMQCHSIGMHKNRHLIAAALPEVLGKKLEALYDKSKETLPPHYAAEVRNGHLLGGGNGAIVKENGHSFWVDWSEGQKTGFFLDQRDNRELLGRYVKGKSVLNAFAYSGGFSVYALAAGARQVWSADVSEKAIAWTHRNVELNRLGAERHEGIVVDVLQFFNHTDNQYDVLVVDPPAFAKSMSKRHNAVQAYKRLNLAAIKCLRPGGILFTFSCSQVVDKVLFYNTIVAAAIESGRKVRVMHYLEQPADHPVQLFHPESSYLKGLALYVE
ncbi:MAG: class I SAM-dependent rRNA methyltransferase [Saprospirales bacterium]|nr:class I SAM-dependent rRNA methyltransferase [Saprospirales bacterium]